MKRMNVTEASQKYAGCELKSELARLCLPAAHRDPNRKLAWVNSICILFLLIGIVGAKSSTTRIKRPPPIEEVVPIVIEAPPPPPTKIEAQQTPEPTEQPKQDFSLVVVTPESPAINFSIPTIGQLVVPNAIAAAPPANPLKAVTPVRNEPRTITNTGQGGDRPTPDYPKLAKGPFVKKARSRVDIDSEREWNHNQHPNFAIFGFKHPGPIALLNT